MLTLKTQLDRATRDSGRPCPAPQPRHYAAGNSGPADPAIESLAEEDELHPAGNPSRNREAGRPPLGVQAQTSRERNGEQIPQPDRKKHADYAEPKRSFGVLQSVEGRGVEPAQGRREQPDGRSGEYAPD